MTAQRRIPVVEDDWLIAADHTDTLEQVGYQVFGPVSSVSAALQMIDGPHIDAAVLDLNLNGQASYPIAELLILMGFGSCSFAAIRCMICGKNLPMRGCCRNPSTTTHCCRPWAS